MEAKKKRYQYNYSIYGNTARKLQVIPEYENDEEIKPVRQPEKRKHKRLKTSPGIDLVSALFLVVAIAVTLYTCIDYLRVQSLVTAQNKEIAQLEHKLTKLQDQNKDALAKINTSLDLNYIYEVATKELGMVYPNENQVIKYKSNLSDYVRQYEKIPEDTDASILDKILK